MKFTKLAMATLFAASVVPFSSMAENTGVVNFKGTVVNSPCNIAQSSLNQTVDFGQLSRKALESGNSAEEKFNIEFTGCDFDNYFTDGDGNAVAVNTMELVFTGQNYADAANTMLATSTGNTNNLGIMIDGFEFGTAKDVLSRIENRVGDNTLTFTAVAKAVDANESVVEGTFSAISNFRITYQ
ncbi:fimbrial protein [uncultured Cedecea sp.]|uniref:fimbrial protein n=1 Tax=uncultured Cedecea sp. TaxID=988762 RepID=UPI00262A0128|nr:fimbrial protein [uncultured Cedecea sp.]